MMTRRTLLTLAFPLAAAKTFAAGPVSPARLYAESVRQLQQGRWFDRCIARMGQAVAAEPGNASFRLALGAALVSRAAALAEAAAHLGEFEADRAKYKAKLERWEEGGQEGPRPEPPSLRTHDDGRPFALTVEQTREQGGALVVRALREFDAALPLSKPGAERAEAHYVRGWGFCLLYRNKGVLSLPAAVTEKAAINEFTRATEEAPDDSRLWRSLGDAHWGFGQKSMVERRGAASAYRQAVELQPRDVTAWYRLSQWDAAQPDGRPAAIDALRQAVKRDAGNAFLWYGLAGLLFAASEPQEAVTTVERGNAAAPRYYPTLTDVAVSPLLHGAWAYKARLDVGDGYDGDPLFALLKAGAEYATGAAARGDEAEGVRAARAMTGIGFKMAGGTGAKSPLSRAADSLDCILASIALEQGYATLEAVHRRCGDAESAAQAKAEGELAKAALSARGRELAQALKNDYGDY